MKARLLIPCKSIVMDPKDPQKMLRDERGRVVEQQRVPGEIIDHPDCFKLVGAKDMNSRSPTYMMRYAEPADEECAAASQCYYDAEERAVQAKVSKHLAEQRVKNESFAATLGLDPSEPEASARAEEKPKRRTK